MALHSITSNGFALVEGTRPGRPPVRPPRPPARRDAPPRGDGKAVRPPLSANDYVTTERLVGDVRALAAALPEDVDAVVGISRSGVLPASLVAYQRHVPLLTVSRQAGLLDPGHGVRMEGAGRPEFRHVLLIDDSCASGREMRANLPTVRAAFPSARVTRAAVYVTAPGAGAVDRFASHYPGQHYFEWNWANAGHGARCAFDFDGILCRDFTAAECRDEAAYRAAMAAITPLHLPRRRPAPLVVTARPESTRGVALEWLARHAVVVEKLVMWPDADWPGPAGPRRDDVAEFKARHYRASSCVLFAESDPAQAAAIADLSGKPVLCPAAGRVFPGRPKSQTRPARPKCDYREDCGCASPKCLHRERGPKFGVASTARTADGSAGVVHRVSAEACAACGGASYIRL